MISRSLPRVFFDTNVFVYVLDQRAPVKSARAQDLIGTCAANHSGVTSYQVAQEFMNVATTRFRKQLSAEEALQFTFRAIWPLCEVFPSAELLAKAARIHLDTGWTFYDSLIVASALFAKCRILYTEDLQHGRVIEGLEIRNPFI